MIPSSIHIEVIDHDQQRYPTVGDWVLDKDGALIIRVSRTPTPLYHYLVALHELVESLCSLYTGVTVDEVDAFDLQWERETAVGEHTDEEEPGDDPRCPCHNEHVLATLVERTVAFFLGVNWREYEDAITTLWNTTRKEVIESGNQ